MRHYQPTLGIRETARNVGFFMQANMEVFWALLKPLLPCIVVLYLLDTLVTGFYLRNNHEDSFSMGSILATYFYFVLMISWTRAVVLGQDNFVPMNPFRPTNSEITYIFMSLVVPAVFLIFGIILGLLAAPMGAGAVFIVILCAAFGLIYVAYKIAFYFPAKALGEHISFVESWRLTNGYVIKMMTVPMMASLKLILMMFVVALVLGTAVFGILFAFFYNPMPEVQIDLQGYGASPLAYLDKSALSIAGFFVNLPLIVYFQPLLFVINATSLCNYYMHAIQNSRH